jgi:hypothetical protein
MLVHFIKLHVSERQLLNSRTPFDYIVKDVATTIE